MTRHNPVLQRSRKAPMTPGRRRLLFVGAILLLTALGWALATAFKPAIQRTIVITSGADNGIYRGFADRYAPILKRDGITLVIRSSSVSTSRRP